MGFLVQKPQFDVDQLKQGIALRIKAAPGRTIPGGWYGFDRKCLVLDAGPLCLTIVYIKEENSAKTLHSVEKAILDSDLVASGDIQITLLTEVIASTEGGRLT